MLEPFCRCYIMILDKIRQWTQLDPDSQLTCSQQSLSGWWNCNSATPNRKYGVFVRVSRVLFMTIPITTTLMSYFDNRPNSRLQHRCASYRNGRCVYRCVYKVDNLPEEERGGKEETPRTTKPRQRRIGFRVKAQGVPLYSTHCNPLPIRSWVPHGREQVPQRLFSASIARPPRRRWRGNLS